MAFDFPASPTEGQEFTPVAGLTYIYNAPSWKPKAVTAPGAALTVGDTPPSNPVNGQLWWESDSGSLFIWYNDGNSAQWVQVNVPSDFTLAPNFVQKAGDTMTGNLDVASTYIRVAPTADVSALLELKAPNSTKRAQIQFARPDLPGVTLFSLFTNGNAAGDVYAFVADDSNTNRNAFLIERATGRMNIVQGPLTLGGGQLKYPATQNPSTDANTLDDFREGTWLPTLTFGGANVGLVYSARSGTYTKVGRMVEARGQITLSAKGTSTGSAFVGGFPLANGSGHYASINFGYYNGLAGISGTLMGLVNLSDSGFQPYVGGAAAVGACTDANFTATSNIVFTVIYETVN